MPRTGVLMADGTSRDIDDIAIGDLVLAADPDTGEARSEPVTDLITGSGEKDLITITADPDHDGRADQLIATAGHPFYTQAGWREASAVVVGDEFQTSTGAFVTVAAVRTEFSVTAKVFNLTVANLHTYFVRIDDAAVLVHNCGIGYTRHGAIQASERSISHDMVTQAVKTGKRTRGNRPGTTKYKGRKVWVVLNQNRCVISCGWNKN